MSEQMDAEALMREFPDVREVMQGFLLQDCEVGSIISGNDGKAYPALRLELVEIQDPDLETTELMVVLEPMDWGDLVTRLIISFMGPEASHKFADLLRGEKLVGPLEEGDLVQIPQTVTVLEDRDTAVLVALDDGGGRAVVARSQIIGRS